MLIKNTNINDQFQKKNILITGGSGLLAINWALLMRNDYSIYLGINNRQIYLENVKSINLNLSSIRDLERDLELIQPELIIHTAGITDVELCELNPNMAMKVNFSLAKNIAIISKKLGIKLIQISTDHLFDGSKSNVTEDEPVNPLNIYGKTKGMAEKCVLDINPESLVVRTNFFAWGPTYRKSFSDTIILKLRKGEHINLFYDVYITPIIVENLATVSHELVKLKANGIYNIVGDERISKYEFGLIVAKIFNLDANLINPISIYNNPKLVKRPLDMSLSNKKVVNLIGKKIGSIPDQITKLLHQEISNYSKEISYL